MYDLLAFTGEEKEGKGGRDNKESKDHKENADVSVDPEDLKIVEDSNGVTSMF